MAEEVKVKELEALVEAAVKKAIGSNGAALGRASGTVDRLLTKLMIFFGTSMLLSVVATAILDTSLLPEVLDAMKTGISNIVGAVLTLAGLKIMHDRETQRGS